MPEVEVLTPDKWHSLKNLRLSALRESPNLFLATYDLEGTYSPDRWRAEFARGTWHACRVNGDWISLLGVITEEGVPRDECFLEYLWVAPGFRRRGIARQMLNVVLGQLSATGVRLANLWVLDGNEVAVMLYERMGFRRTRQRQRIEARPGRTEERMELPLDGWPPPIG
jgi:ribosomal protein S18 acetylase RimI-like enzyme